VSSYLSIPNLAEHQTADFNLLFWWKDRESIFQKISKVARKVFSVILSVAIKEMFNSPSGSTVTKARSCLAPQNVDMILFCFHNTPPEMNTPKLADALQNRRVIKKKEQRQLKLRKYKSFIHKNSFESLPFMSLI
jgi:hypothetical protein